MALASPSARSPCARDKSASSRARSPASGAPDVSARFLSPSFRARRARFSRPAKISASAASICFSRSSLSRLRSLTERFSTQMVSTSQLSRHSARGARIAQLASRAMRYGIGETVDSAALQKLVVKYTEMRRLRILALEAPHADPRAEMAALAAQFPGALREIDELPLEEIDVRL